MLGRKMIQIDSVDSTNNYVAKLLIEQKIEHGTVIMAEEQTAGKGQRGTVWSSKPGENLIFSIYLDTAKLSVREQFVLTQFVSVSVAEMLRKQGLNPVVKWPNDVLINHKKIAGILIENQLSGQNLNGTIVGIGLNVNQIEFGELNATSMCLEKNQKMAVQEIAFSLIHELNRFWEYVENRDFNLLNQLYLSNMWLLNVPAKFTDNEGMFEGIIRGFEESGLLRMEKNGSIVNYDLKEIAFNFEC